MSAEELIRPKARILLIEDEEKLAETLADYLGMNEYQVVCAFTGDRGLELFYDRMHELDLILLDIMLPDISGTEILKEIRKRSRVPVIMVTARDSVRDQLQNFENGADDYLTKPYVLSVVKAHIEAVLKRTGKLQEQIEAGGILLQPQSRKVFCGGKEIGLTAKEFEVLELLMLNPNKVYSRESLLKLVWGADYPGDVRTVDVHIRRLREKIEENPSEPKYVHTKWGVGYYFLNA